MNQNYEKLKKDLENLIDKFNKGWHEGIEIDASDIMLLSDLRELLEQKTGKAALSKPETVTLPDGWVSIETELPSKPCFAYYKNELGNSRTVKAKYVKQFSEEAHTDDDWIEYNEADDTYYYPAGWYEMIDNWDDYAFVTINHQVTHWMPLPAAPTLNEKG